MQLLAEGRPVEPRRVADAVGLSVKDTERLLLFDLPAHLDGEGRVVALSLSLEPTPHRVTIDGRTLYSWCVGQALMYPLLLLRDVRLESPCRGSGRRVQLELSPRRVERADPAGAVIASHALAEPEPSLRRCDDMQLFASGSASTDWHGRHPEAAVLPASEAYERYLGVLGRLFARPQ